ncbi:MAG: amidophosphoribosyltransferase [Bacteroidales bacterium]|nr:amidophosphoribosyltransferase [Bacteroidales bacterium]MBN2763958.1 amidophosphoribosyltransferase [Bacteroidales bacterium]
MSGFFGSVSKQDCVNDVFYGTDYNSHLGTKRGGMCVYGEKGFERAIHSLENDYFRTKFEPELPMFSGHKGIGIISDWQSQPLIINSHMGTFALAIVGKISNWEELEKRALKQCRHFSEMSGRGTNQTELVAMLIAEEETFVEGIKNVFERIKGSCSMLILLEDGIIAARDKLGRTPVVLGHKKDAWAVTSETISFPNLGYEIDRDLGPGEIVHITAEGVEQLAPPGEKMQICAFLWVYYGYPASIYEGVNVESCRYRCGAAIARNDKTKVDFVSGIPDSGLAHAIGYSIERKLPYYRAFVKYTPTWPRSFMPQDQSQRDFIARMKLIPNREMIENKRMVFCDDSIVRGTQLKDNTKKLFDEGAAEVHIRIACPTLLFPCEFLNFSNSRSTLDLAGRKAVAEIEGTDDVDYDKYLDENSDAHREMIDRIRKRLKINSLKFQKMSDLVTAIGLPKEKLCTHCWDKSGFG